MTKNQHRETGYDILRLLACLGVVFIHARLDRVPGVVMTQQQIAIQAGFGGAACFAVPVFFLLSGALVLSRRETADFGAFYRRSFSKLGISTLLFSALYVLFDYALLLKTPPTDKSAWLAPVKGLLLGAPGNILWFMYTLAGLYLLAPLLARLKAGMTHRQFAWLGIVCMVLGSITKATITFKLHWGMTFVLYSGYFILGNVVYETLRTRPRVPRAAFLGCGAALCIGMGVYIYFYMLGKVPEGLWPLGDTLHPVSAAAGLLLVAGATGVQKSWRVAAVSGLTYEIYLWHWGVSYLVMSALAGTKLVQTPTVAVLVSVPVTVLLSMLLAWLTHPLLTRLGKRCDAWLTARGGAKHRRLP